MPRLALSLYVLWFLILLVVRTLVQWKKTGSTGIKGFHGQFGSLPWFAGVGTSLGFVLAPIAPLSLLFAWPGSALFLSNPALHLAGAALMLIGTFGALLAQLSMGDSWRVGVGEAEDTALVTSGIFSWVRNPIFTFMWLTLVGILFLTPNLFALSALLLGVVGIELQVRYVEEPYLLKTHGAVYRDYARRVGRFVPGSGSIHPNPGT